MSEHIDEALDSRLFHVSLSACLFCTDEFLPDSESFEDGPSTQHKVCSGGICRVAQWTTSLELEHFPFPILLDNILSPFLVSLERRHHPCSPSSCPSAMWVI